MTAPRPVGRAELEHPPWCEVDKCSLVAMAAGGCHQREWVVVDDEGTKVASVVLRQYARGTLRVGLASWARAQEWPPRTAELIAAAMLEAKRFVDEMQRA